MDLSTKVHIYVTVLLAITCGTVSGKSLYSDPHKGYKVGLCSACHPPVRDTSNTDVRYSVSNKVEKTRVRAPSEYTPYRR